MRRISNTVACAIALVLSVLIATPAWSQGEHTRRVAAELLVMQSDAQRMFTSPELSTLHQTGLKKRIGGGLAGLTLLLRLADQENHVYSAKTEQRVDKLRSALRNRNYEAFGDSLSVLINEYPLTTSQLLPAVRTPERIAIAKKLHATTCAACHDTPNEAAERPAFNLFMQSNNMPLVEFAARMLVGVRGDRMTGLGNPLSDDQIAALIAYYQSRKK